MLGGSSCNYKGVFSGSGSSSIKSFSCHGCTINTFTTTGTTFNVTSTVNSSAPWSDYIYVNHGYNSTTIYYNMTLTISTFSNAPCLDPCLNSGGIILSNSFFKCGCPNNIIVNYPNVCTVNCSNILYTNGTIDSMNCIC